MINKRTISRQYRRQLTRALLANPVLAQAWKWHKRIVAEETSVLRALWYHYRVERWAGAPRWWSLKLAVKWMGRKTE